MHEIKKVWIALFAIFLFLILVAYNFVNRPYMHLIIKYKDVPPVIENLLRGKIDAYYRGYKVGKVSQVSLSPDQKNIVFNLDINYKNLRLPKNIKIFLDSEDIYGARHFYIYYPDKPSSELLKDGSVVYGSGIYERLDKYLVSDLKSGKLSKLVSNLIELTNFATGIVGRHDKNTQKLLQEAQKSGNNAGTILEVLSRIMQDPQVQNEIKSTIKYSSSSIKDLNQIIQEPQMRKTISNAPELINTTVENLKLVNKNIPEVNDNIVSTNSNISEANVNIAEANGNIQNANKSIRKTNSLLKTTSGNLKTINSKIPYIPSSLVENADQGLKLLNCMGSGLSDMLSQRFLVFRLLFGKPGAPLAKCKNCCLKNQNIKGDKPCQK